MDIETLRDYCIQKPGVTESFPFGPDTLVFKVGGKMFLLTNLDNPSTFNAKCDPERAISLRDEYDEVAPGYHMNKKHWNTISLNGTLTIPFLKELIDHSYDLVFSGLSRTEKENINHFE